MRKKASEWLSALSLSEYVREATKCIGEEENRIAKYMHLRTKRKIRIIFNKEMLTERHKEVLQREKGLGYLLKTNALDV